MNYLYFYSFLIIWSIFGGCYFITSFFDGDTANMGELKAWAYAFRCGPVAVIFLLLLFFKHYILDTLFKL